MFFPKGKGVKLFIIIFPIAAAGANAQLIDVNRNTPYHSVFEQTDAFDTSIRVSCYQ